MKILVINGPNLNLLGVREPSIYGKRDYQELERTIEEYCEKQGIDVTVLQSNSEGEIIDFIHFAMNNFDGIVINPAAYTHYSYAIADAIGSVDIPAVEVHLSDISKREDFRKISVTKEKCIAQVFGKGFDGYLEAIEILKKHLKSDSGDKK